METTKKVLIGLGIFVFVIVGLSCLFISTISWAKSVEYSYKIEAYEFCVKTTTGKIDAADIQCLNKF